MILHNIANAFRNQNWFVAIIEILIVVIGIFLGLQVDDWNQQRKDSVDETRFLKALHEDLMLSSELSVRVRERRLFYYDWMLTTNDVLFGRDNRAELAEDECRSIGSSNYYNINVSGFSSVDELSATGRMGIIRDLKLRRALIELQQTREALLHYIRLQSAQNAFSNLSNAFPELLQMYSFQDENGEVRASFTCDLEGMRSSHEFLNAWAANIDGYDAYIRDGFLPWIEAYDNVHEITDHALGVTH
jgi:hypothetical protein